MKGFVLGIVLLAALIVLVLISPWCNRISQPRPYGPAGHPSHSTNRPCYYVDGALPDPHCTPGALNPTVTPGNIYSTVCVPGYTTTIRPPSSETNRIKRERMAAYDVDDRRLVEYQLDHLVSLVLGGHPDHPDNLWPQPNAHPDNWTAKKKDRLEKTLAQAVCRGELPLTRAQDLIRTDWIRTYQEWISYAPLDDDVCDEDDEPEECG